MAVILFKYRKNLAEHLTDSGIIDKSVWLQSVQTKPNIPTYMCPKLKKYNFKELQRLQYFIKKKLKENTIEESTSQNLATDLTIMYSQIYCNPKHIYLSRQSG